MAKLKFKINVPEGAVVSQIRVNESVLEGDNLKAAISSDDPNILEGEISFVGLLNTVIISVMGVGTANQEGSLNFSYEGRNLFASDPTFKVRSDSSRFRFYRTGVLLT